MAFEKSPEDMTAQVRVALGASIFQNVAGPAIELPVMVLDPPVGANYEYRSSE